MNKDEFIFSKAWMKSWHDEINKHSEYKNVAADWKNPIILKITSPNGIFEDEKANGFWLDLFEGQCRDIRYAFEEDEKSTEIILTSDKDTWLSVIRENKDPLFMLMKGSIKLEKGSMIKLASRRKAAKALLDAACQVSGPSNEIKAVKISSKQNGTHDLTRTSFVTTGRGLDMDSFPMQLFQKSKTLGIWNPSDISFDEDARQWKQFNELEKTVLLHLSSLFIAGEEAVTLDLLPLIQAVSREGRIEEEMYLTSFLWEEAKHTEFFALFLDKVVGNRPDLTQFHFESYRKLFYGELHSALQSLNSDPAPINQLKASITYNMIVEGILAETGYEAYFNMLESNNMLPGLRKGIGLLKQDESRHIAYGLFFIKRILTENPELESYMEEEMSRLLDLALNVVNEMFEPYPVMPFGLEKSWYIEFASGQFIRRLEKLAIKH